MARPKKNSNENALLATGGGNATASGVTFQGSVAADIAVQIITESFLDHRLSLGAATPVSIRLETEVPVDDILVETDQSGWVFIQGKNSLQNSSALSSELGKTCDEFCRLWQLTMTGSGIKGWDRPLISGRDAMVIAVGSTTSNTIKAHLARSLDALRSGSTAIMSADQKNALASIRKLVIAALSARGGALALVEPDDILKFVHVLAFDFGGPHRNAAAATLAHMLEDQSTSSAAFSVLERECESLMSIRGRADRAKLRAIVARSGIGVKAPPNFARDVQVLRARTDRVADDLADFQKTNVAGVEVTIHRACTQAVASAAGEGSFVVVGDPGAGKSAVINEAAKLLKEQGREIVLLAVDSLQVETIEGLTSTLGLTHTIVQVLANWPGVGPAYLFLDALDACRFGQSEALFRTFIQEVLRLDGGRWRVIASIRTFDLVVGQEFGRLFRGIPPHPDFVDPRFQTVSHIRIPEWSENEFADLLSKIPSLNTAIVNGGPKLRELARVPFNTRLLADLLTDGVEPEAFERLYSQVQLLDMYWNRRVRPLGAPAEQCLRNVISAMIEKGRMDAGRLDASTNTGEAVDQLLRAGVLVSTSTDRNVAFRHHILFDFVASRVLIDLADLPRLNALLKKSGSALLLAPALNFALQELWENAEEGRQEFWQVAIQLIGGVESDPIVRSVSARAASNLPNLISDMQGLLSLMLSSESDARFDAFRHIVGSLSVRIEDDISVPDSPWCHLASCLSPIISKVAWPMRQLIGNFIDRVSEPALREELGQAARALLNHAFNAQGGEFLMPLAIGYAGKTFTTDVAASRQLFKRLLDPDRMNQYAVNDMPWIAEQVEFVVLADAELAVDIYRRAFQHKIAEDSETYMGQSQILPLRSNRKQDYRHSQWRLKEAFPAILVARPLEAADIALVVAKAYIANEHAPSEDREPWSFMIGHAEETLFDDYSHVWAWEHHSTYADYEQQIVDLLVESLRTCAAEKALVIVEHLLLQEKPAWIWARLFMVAAERGGSLTERLWPIAAQPAFLKSSDTIKDALDLITKGYDNRRDDERRAFEQSVLDMAFPKALDPKMSRAYYHRRIFGSLGIDALLLEESKAIVRAALEKGEAFANERPFRISSADWVERSGGEFDWLREQGADVDAERNSEVLRQITYLKEAKAADSTQSGIAIRLGVDAALAKSLQIGSADVSIAAYGWEQLASDLVEISHSETTILPLQESEKIEAFRLLDEVILVSSSSTADEKQVEASEKTRELAAEAALNFCLSDKNTAQRFKTAIIEFSNDVSHRVRRAVSSRLGYLWDTDQELLWALAGKISERETDAGVLLGMVNFLIRGVHQAPEQVEVMTQTLLARTDIDDGSSRSVLSEGFGTLTFILWVRHYRQNSRDTITRWMVNRIEYKSALLRGAFSLQSGLVLGYEQSGGIDVDTRRRCQGLAFEMINASARGLEEYLALPKEQRTAELQKAASADAEILDRISDQFLFSVGAPEIHEEKVPKALVGMADRRQFLIDNEASFRRVGDAGTPHTIYYLLQLLEFLMPSDPPRVFDLVAHALLKAGKLHGYQLESIGANQFVQMTGRFVADHRELFGDQRRREKLIEVLEVFVDAGWPSARRLLYRLPEALR